jgi:uncharacterized protein (AIM24 family)
VPGAIRELQLDSNSQWRIADNAFLACESTVSYEMKKQSIGKAIFAGTGGLFVMETKGHGKMLINSYGDLLQLQVNGNEPLIVDNTHVVAWSSTLNYNIRAASGTFGFKSGEGLVNEFNGVGSVFVQTRNIQSLGVILSPFIQKGS